MYIQCRLLNKCKAKISLVSIQMYIQNVYSKYLVIHVDALLICTFRVDTCTFSYMYVCVCDGVCGE